MNFIVVGAGWAGAVCVLCIGAGCSSGPAESELGVGGPGMSAETSIQRCLERPAVLAGGVRVVCTSTDVGVFAARLDYSGRIVELDLLRDATFYGLSEAPGVVVVHHRMYSNDDSLILLDMTGPATKRIDLAHPDGGEYGHTHYEVSARQHATISVVESHRAYVHPGGDRPRSRTITVSLREGQFAQTTATPWKTF